MIGFRQTSRLFVAAAVMVVLLMPASPAVAAPDGVFAGAQGALVSTLEDLGQWLLRWWPGQGSLVTKGGAGMDPDGGPTSQGGAGMDPNGNPTGQDTAGMDPNGREGVAGMACGDDTAGLDPDGSPCAP